MMGLIQDPSTEAVGQQPDLNYRYEQRLASLDPDSDESAGMGSVKPLLGGPAIEESNGRVLLGSMAGRL